MPGADAQPHPELATATIGGLGRRLEEGSLTCARLAGMYLERIAAIDRGGPCLRAVIELNPDAEALAAGLDREPRRGPLHGMPVLLKDNIDTGDQMLTTAGSLALTAAPAAADADLVAGLRRAGALILGKTNLSEWANFRSTRSASGWSGRGRQTRNPHVLDRSPCGSSSGSAVAAAAGLAAAAVGTETDGSIVCPASVNGVVGIKPTVGAISQRGIIPISASQDSAGPHARSVADAAALLGTLTDRPDDYTRHLDPEALRGARIGVLRDPYTGYSEHTDAVFERALAMLKTAGAVLVDPVELPGAAELRSSGVEQTVLLYEFHAGLDAYLGSRPGGIPGSLAELIAYNRQHAAEEMPYFGQERFEQALAKSPISDPEYAEARARARLLAGPDGIDAALAAHSLDALVAPSTGPAWVVDPLNGDRSLGASSQPAAVAGYPIVSVPAGMVAGALPVGLNLFAGAGAEARLIALAHAFELARGPFPAPRYLPTLELP